jgi:phosphate:Na+ symporter
MLGQAIGAAARRHEGHDHVGLGRPVALRYRLSIGVQSPAVHLRHRVLQIEDDAVRFMQCAHEETALGTPPVALACAEREVLHLGDIVESMLLQSMTALMTDDRRLAAEVSRMDNTVDGLDEAVKLYVTRLTRESLDERDGHRAMEIIAFSIKLEHIGDIIDKNLMELAQKKIKRKLAFSKQRAAELETFDQEVMSNLKLALSAFMSGDVKIARQLIAEKATLRTAERAAAD